MICDMTNSSYLKREVRERNSVCTFPSVYIPEYVTFSFWGFIFEDILVGLPTFIMQHGRTCIYIQIVSEELATLGQMPELVTPG